MVYKFSAISLAVVIGYIAMLVVSNQQITTINFVLFDVTEKPIGRMLAYSILASFLFGVSGSVVAWNKLTSEKKKTAKLSGQISGLKKDLEKMKKEYAFQEKKVCFLEDTIRSDDEPPPSKKPQKQKKPLFPWKVKFEKKK